MKTYVFYLAIALTLRRVTCEGEGDKILDIISDASDLANKVQDYMNSGQAGTDDILDLLTTVITITETNTNAMFRELSLQIQFDKLENDILHIGYSYTRLLLYLQASNDTQVADFEEFYQTTDQAVKHTHFLAQRLTETVPGINNNILDILATRSRCNMTTLEVFQEFYYDVLQNGMMLDLFRQSLKGDGNTDTVEKHWMTVLQTIGKLFSTRSKRCVDQLQNLLWEDMDSFENRDVSVLQKNNSQRYTWIWNDVLLLRNDVGVDKLYFDGNVSYYEKRPATVSGQLDVTVVYAKRDSLAENVASDELTNIISNLVPIGALNDAEVVASSVKTFLCDRNYTVELIIVFLVNNDNIGAMSIDTDTHAVSVVMTTGGQRFQIYMVLVRSRKCTDLPVEGDVSTALPVDISAASRAYGPLWMAMQGLLLFLYI